MKRSPLKRKTPLKATTPLRGHRINSKPLKVAKGSKSRTKTKTQAQLKKELDQIFSIFIRKIHPARCYTCGKTEVKLQCGHFVSRSYLATRFHEDNCRPQCVGCNLFGNGKPLDFEENLKKELGEEYVEDMKKSRHDSPKLDRHWYGEKIAYYKGRVKELENQH